MRGEIVDDDTLLSVKDNNEVMDSIVDNEMEVDKISSASRFGWGNVKYYENYCVLKDQKEAEKKLHRFHQAEGTFKGTGGKGRGKIHPYSNLASDL